MPDFDKLPHYIANIGQPYILMQKIGGCELNSP